MGFLELNGLTIPIADSGQMKPGEIGGTSQAFLGTPHIERRGNKREWKFTTTQLTETEYNLVSALLHGKGFLWFHEEMNQYATKGSDITTGTVLGGGFTTKYGEVGTNPTTALPCPVYDQNGEADAKSDSAVSIGVSTRDVAANIGTGGDTNGDTTGFYTYGGGGPAIARSTAYAWRGTGSIKATPGAPNDGIQWDVNTLTPAQPYLVTAYVLATVTGNVKVRLENGANVTAWTSDIPVVANQWTRIVQVITAPAAGVGSIQVVVSSVEGDPFYIDGILCVDSYTGYATPPWFDGATSPAHTMQIPLEYLLNFRDATIAAWVKMDWTDEDKIIARLFFMQSHGPRYYDVKRVANSDDLQLNCTDHLGGSINHVEADVFSDQEWHHIAVAMRWSPPAGTNGVEFWVDGVLVYSSATRFSFDFPNLESDPRIGDWYGSGDWFGIIDELLIFPAAITQEMVTAMQTANWAALPALRATGDFINEQSLDVMPQNVSDDYAHGNIAGTWTPNQRVISFELREL